MFPIANAGSIQYPSDSVISDSGQVFNPSATNKYNRVFLKIVTLTSDVRIDLKSVRQPHPTNFTQCRIRFLWRRGIYPDAYSTPLRATLQRRYVRLGLPAFPRLSNKLTNSGQLVSPYELARTNRLVVSKGAPF